jgi:hypothetical protein
VLDAGQLAEFEERGFLVLPRVVPPDVVAAASAVIDELVRHNPPGPEVRGPHNYFPGASQAPALTALLTGSPAFGLAESLTGAGTLEVPAQVQVALNIPPFRHRPGMHHLDGVPPEPGGRPGTFTMLAGVLMSDQRERDAGNLWVWPGTHLTHAAYFRAHGPDALVAAGGYPPIPLPEPEQVTGRGGDLLLAHYLLGHNIGGNISAAVRRAVYFRIKRSGHDARWREFVGDPWLDYDTVPDRE